MEALAPLAARFPRRHRHVALAVLLAAAALCAPATASAATRYIDDTGNDTSNTCLNAASPCRSFNRAYQVSSPGDIVMVASGSYGNQSIAEKAGAAAPSVEFRAETGATIALGSVGIQGSYVSITGAMSATGLDVDGGANSAANKPVRSVLVDGMNVDGRNSVSVIGYMRGVNGLTLRNVDIANSNNNSLMLADQDAAAGGVSNVWLDYAAIHDAHLDAGSSAHTECFYAQGIDGLKITNSHFYRCAVMDVFITRWSGTTDDPSNGWIENNVFEAPLAAGNTCCSSNAFHFRNGGEPAPDIDNWDFRYNTFLGALSFGTTSENVVKPSGLRVVGNIFSGGTTCRSTNATFAYNLYAGGTCGGVGETSTTASALNAGFVGPTTQANAGNNFRLTASSPAIDRGNAADFPGTDQDGGLRPSGLKADVGAFEYAAGAPPADTTAPDTSITSSPSSPTSSTSASLVFSGTDNVGVASYECTIDGGAWAACTSPKAYSGLALGSHTFSVRAKDAAGNVDATPATATWTITAPADTTAPDTSITSAPAASTTSTSASIAFTGSDNVGVTGYECKLDAGAYGSCTSPAAYSGLALGSHTFSVRAKDAAGNVDATPATATWTITAPADTTAPDTSIGSSPSSPTSSTSASLAFSGTDNVGVASYECMIDGGAWAACTSPKAYSALADGSHTFSVRAKDAAGNVDASPATATWTVDATAPDTSVTSAPAALTASASASLGFSSADGSATFECRLDGGAWAACTSPKAYSALADGSHTFNVRAKDAVGNVDATPAAATWTVDTTAPDTSITTAPASLTASASASLGFTSPDGSASFECKLDAGAWAACTSLKAYSALADGAHAFNVRAKDAAGNVDATPATAGWTVDTVAPDTSLGSSPSSPTSSTSASLTFSSADGSASFECRLDGGAWATCSSPRAYSGLADGTHTFTVRAKDAAGNVDATPAGATWTVDTAVPDTTAPDTAITDQPAASTTSTSASVAFTGSDDVGVTGFECKLDGGAWASCASPADQAGLALGDHTFSVRAEDAAGNVDATPATVTWTVVTPPDTTAPDTTLTAEPAPSTTSTTATFAFASTEGGSTFECRTDAETWGSCASPHVDNPVDLGAHTFSVRAEDPAGNVDPTPASVDWSVVAPTPAPAPALETTIVTKPAALTSDRRPTFTLAANVANPSFDCSLDGAAWKACAATVRYSLSYGGHTFRARAKSGGLIDTTPASYSWTISRRARAASYSFDVLSTQDSGATTVEADGAATACAQAGRNGRVAVRITGIGTRRAARRLRISGVVPAFAVDHGKARIRVSVRRGHGWRLLASRRAVIRNGRFTVRAPRARGTLKVAAVVRCS